MTNDSGGSAIVERIRLALDMYQFGENMMREQIARAHSDLSLDEIETRLLGWLGTRPGAENGDVVGRSVSWPRSSTR